MHLTLALNYGSRNEILNAFKSLAKKEKKKIIEDDISLNLMTKNLPDPDFVIRTSGEKRLSNLFIMANCISNYTTKTLWPDFTVQKYMPSFENYISRKRRSGGN